MYLVKSCCCGYSLKQGTTALLIITLVVTVLDLILKFENYYFSFTSLFLNLIVLTICLVGLYGIEKQKANYIVPFTIYQLFSLLVFALSFMILIIYESAFFEYLEYVNNTDHVPKNIEQVLVVYDGMFFIAILVIGSLSALQTYFCIVTYSYYKELRENTGLPSVFP